jgi:nicotinamide mononucleotide transporter PnuC
MLDMTWTEVAGFATGVVSVWLYVRQRVWAWPVGIANSSLWLVLFWDSRLYLDAGLQVVYVAIGLWGWFWWVNGGPERNELPVSRTRTAEATALGCGAVVGIAALWWAMTRQADAMPFWDSVTTVVSLVAQYMLTRKLLGNWWCWMAVDVIYVGVYTAQGLYLTAALQPLFFAMCVVGLRSWRSSLAARTAPVQAVQVAS